MKVLVTGGSGLLGNNIVRELLKRNYPVKVFDPQVDSSSLKGLDIERVEGDILDEKAVMETARDTGYIIHAAANTSIWPYRSEMIRSVNIDGTKNIVKSALKNEVSRLISIGSATSFGNGTEKNPGTEKSAFTASKFGLDYIDSKYEAQQLILRSVKEDGLEAIILNPTFMLGPYDTKPSSGELLLALYSGKIPGYTNGGRNYIHVQDVAIAACNALTMGRTGECYIMANQNLSYSDFNKLVAEELDIRAPRIKVPNTFIMIYGTLAEAFARLIGKVPAISIAIAKISLITNYYSAQKAISELDLPQTPIAKAIRDAFDWFKANNYLDKQ